MRPDRHDRYARHIQLPDFGTSGQTAMMQASAHLLWTVADSRAPIIAATYLAAGGVGKLVVPSATQDQRNELADCGSDTLIGSEGTGRSVVCPQRPSWWPDASGDEEALAFFRGGIAATKWMADVPR